MKGFAVISILLLCLNLLGQAEIWEKKGVTGGIIQEIVYDRNLGLYIILTDSGIYKSENLSDWFPMNEGLMELAPYDFAWVPIDSTKSLYVVLTRDGVFGRVFSNVQEIRWPYFVYANPSGLEDSSGTTLGYQMANRIGIYKQSSTFYVYLSLEGHWLYKRQFDPFVQQGQNPWITDWQRENFDPGTIFNPYVACISSLDGGNIFLIGTKSVGTYSGKIFRKQNGAWQTVGSSGVIYTSFSEDPSSGNFIILAGTASNGVFISNDGGVNFNLICNQNPGYGPWKGLSFTLSGSNIYVLGSAYDNASSMEKLFFINPQDCNNGFVGYSYFTGESTTVYLKDNLYAYVGTLGQGIWEYSSISGPGKPIGVKGGNRIIFNNVSDIAFVKSNSRPDAPPTILASSRSEGFYKCFKEDYCTRYFYSPFIGKIKQVRGTSLAVVPGYDEYGEIRYTGEDTIIGKKTIFLGTMDSGLFRSDNGGASWRKILSFPVDSNSGREFEIVKVLLAPDFDPYNQSSQHIFVLTRDAKIFFSPNGGENWSEEVNLNQANLRVIGEDLAIPPAYNSNVPSTQNVFVAISFPKNISPPAPSSILKRVWSGQKFIWNGLPFNLSASRIALSPCFGLPSCPECPTSDPECIKEMTTILVGTKRNGLHYSPNSGNNFYQLVGDGICPGSNTSINALSFHPRTDVPNIQNRLLNYATANTFFEDGSQTSNFVYIYQENNPQPRWKCVDASTGELPDHKINKIFFAPGFGQNNNWKIIIGHEVKGMYKNNHPLYTNGNPPQPVPWENLKGFYNVPDKILSIAECPDIAFTGNPNKIVVAGTENYGVMISFDSGESYFPFGEGFEYTGTGGEKYTLHNAPAVSCTGIFDPCDEPSPCHQHRLIASSSDCTQFDTNGNCTSKIYKGILNTEFKNFSFISRWRESRIDGNSMDGHFVTEIRYCSQDLPVYAADYGVGVLYSNKSSPDSWGMEWHLDTSGNYPVDITDLTCPGGQSGPSLRASASSPDLRPGRGQFIWGAQSGGGGGGLRAGNGTAKFKTSAFGSWQVCTGLSNDANWRAIVMLSSQNVLIGSQGSTGEREGIWRNSQEGETCNFWENANMGFKSGDSSQITKNYSKKITAFAKVANGVLVSMESDPAQDNGGVFFSDTDSDGLAWVPVNSGMSCTSNYEVYNGQTIYTGSSCNGVYSTTQISYTGYPTAYFTYESSSNPWYETRFTFYDRSAGLPTAREWDFDNDSEIDATPSSRTYTYDFNVPFGYSSYNTKIISYQNSYSDTYQLSDDSRNPVEIVYTKIPKIEKDGSYIKIYWDRITSGGHDYVYNIYSSSSPQGTSASLLASINDGTSGSDYDCTTSLCWYRFEESSSEKYYRLKTTW